MNANVTAGERFFFVHLQKTAGTTLFRRLKRHFGADAVYPNASDGDIVAAVIEPQTLLARWKARSHEIRAVTGHFPFCTTELLGGGFTTLTVVREPVARTLSYLRHHRKLTPADADRSLEEIYEDPFRFHGLVHNHMVKMFSLSLDEMADGVLTKIEFTPERLEQAKENLGRVDALGLQERFDEFCDELAIRFGWDDGEREHANRSEPTEVAQSFVERIADDNAMDVAFYEFASRLYADRHGEAPVVTR